MNRRGIRIALLFAISCIFLGPRPELLPKVDSSGVGYFSTFGNIQRQDEESLIKTEDRVVYLDEVGEIHNGFSDADNDYFENISSLSLDKDDNLYVADSGVHKIFMFNRSGMFQFSFGKLGQGPAEFLGDLRISIGNDDKVYVTDDENWRLYVFSRDGKIIKEFAIYKYIYDTAVANSDGEIFLLSPGGISLIDYYDKDMSLIGSLLECSSHMDFPLVTPPARIMKNMSRPSVIDLKKLMTKEDELILISNNSLLVWIFNRNRKLLTKFKIVDPQLIKNYQERLADMKSRGAWLQCFGSAFLDEKGNICLSYYNTDVRQPEIYQFQREGDFIDVLRMSIIREDKVYSNRMIEACDSNGNMYGIDPELQRIVIYKKKRG